MPRLVRRQSLAERLSSYLNPLDVLLLFSTHFEAYDWDSLQQSLSTPIGLAANVLCLISRANAGNGRPRGEADILRRPGGGTMGWTAGLSYFLWALSWGLAVLSVMNAVYCFTRKRRYRLFETNIEIEPATPSAHRVRVDSSPSRASPFRFLSNLIEPLIDNPDARAHPLENRDVWEVSIWDPTPLSLRLFALFSPAHVALYFLSLPIASASNSHYSFVGSVATPSTNPINTIFIVIVTQILISVQLLYSEKSFTQQAKDTALIHKEVLHEYDTKYVHPRLNVIKRDVAVQCSDAETGQAASVDVFTPTFNRQGFRTAPNPNYAEITMQNQLSARQQMSRLSSFGTPGAYSPSPQKGSMRQPQFGIKKSSSVSSGFNGIGDEYPTTSSVGSRDSGSGSGYGGVPRNSNVGMHGLVNLSTENSRSLSPSKMSTPLKKGYGARGSTYAGSLGTPLRSPTKRSFGI